MARRRVATTADRSVVSMAAMSECAKVEMTADVRAVQLDAMTADETASLKAEQKAA